MHEPPLNRLFKEAVQRRLKGGSKAAHISRNPAAGTWKTKLSPIYPSELDFKR